MSPARRHIKIASILLGCGLDDDEAHLEDYLTRVAGRSVDAAACWSIHPPFVEIYISGRHRRARPDYELGRITHRQYVPSDIVDPSLLTAQLRLTKHLCSQPPLQVIIAGIRDL